MRKKFIAIIIGAIVTVLCAFCFMACGKSEGKGNVSSIEELKFDEITVNEQICYEVAGMGTVTGGVVSIPATYNDKPVVSIKEMAFHNSTGLTSITIPNSVTSIGESAFSSCRNLESIEMPDSLTSISDSLFNSCSSLTGIVIPDSVTSIGNFAFQSCSSLTNITIGSGITNIGDMSFYYCRSLTSIRLGSNIASVGKHAFRDCNKLTIYCEAESKPSGWNSDWNYSDCSVIWDCKNNDKDESGYVHAEIDRIQYSIKDGVAAVSIQSDNIRRSITLPDSISYKDVTYSVTSIVSNAFSNCTRLTSITISDSITNIGDSAFRGCGSMTKIEMPNSIVSVGNYAFSECIGLTRITIPDSVVSIGDSAFSGCSRLINIDMPNSVASIGKEAFSGCSAITNITIPDNVTIIDWGMFQNCSKLTGIDIPNGVQSIGYGAFRNCSSLTSVTIPNSVTSIGRYAFDGCTQIDTATLSAFAISFMPQTALKTVVISGGTSIEQGAFANCGSLESVTIPDSVISIGWGAFMSCSKLKSISVDSNNPNYSSQDGILYNKDKSQIIHVPIAVRGAVALPESIISIDNSTFSGCEQLTSISIPKSVTTIGRSAFYGCGSLTTINYNGNIADWKEIEKGRDWNSNSGNYTVICDDGTISKSES